MKINKFLFIIVFYLVLIPSVDAICSYQEQADLLRDVSNIKVNYEEKRLEERVGDFVVTNDIFKVNVLNLSENYYITVTSNNDRSFSKRLNYFNNKDGVISFNWDKLDKVTTLNFKVYTSSKTNCPNELYRNIYLTLPRYNAYSSLGICDGKEVNICDKYVTTEELSYDEFIETLNNITDSGGHGHHGQGEKDNNGYLIYIIGGSVLVVIMAAVIVIINRRRRNKI